MDSQKTGLVDMLEDSLWPKIDYMQQELGYLEMLISALLNRFVLPLVEKLLTRGTPDPSRSSFAGDNYRAENVIGCVRSHRRPCISTGVPVLDLYNNASMNTLRAQDQPLLDPHALHTSLLLRMCESDSPTCANYYRNQFLESTEQERLVSMVKRTQDQYKDETANLAAKVEALKHSFQQLNAQFYIHELEHHSSRPRRSEGGTGKIRRSNSIYTLKTLKTVHSLCDLGKSTRQVYAESLKLFRHTDDDDIQPIRTCRSKSDLLKVHFASPSRRNQRLANRIHADTQSQQAVTDDDSSSSDQDQQQEDDTFDELTSLFESSVFFKDKQLKQNQQTSTSTHGQSMHELESIVSRLSLADDD